MKNLRHLIVVWTFRMRGSPGCWTTTVSRFIGLYLQFYHNENVEKNHQRTLHFFNSSIVLPSMGFFLVPPDDHSVECRLQDETGQLKFWLQVSHEAGLCINLVFQLPGQCISVQCLRKDELASPFTRANIPSA